MERRKKYVVRFVVCGRERELSLVHLFNQSQSHYSRFVETEMESISQAARFEIRDPELIQFYSAATPNGIKVAAALEEIKVNLSTCHE